MGLTNFPNGITSFGVPVMGSGGGIPATTGNYYFVSSTTGSNDNDGKTKDSPVATLAKAFDLVTASKMDVIVLMPSHAENVSTAAAISADVAGVTVVGVGVGTLRPKFSFTHEDATFVISAANQTWINVQWEANVADVKIGLDVSAVDDLTFQGCWFTEAGSNLNFIDVVDLATGADRIAFRGCTFIGGDVANDAFISGVAHNGLFISDCIFYANVAQTAAHGLIVSTGNCTNIEIKNCSFRSNVDGAIFIDLDGTANSGVISNCYFSSIDDADAVTTGFDVTGAHVFECYVAGEADSFGIVGGGTVYNNA
jgi:hypothetical protein